MVTAWFAKIAGIELEQVSYRGGGQAINDLIAGHVKLGTLGSTPLIPHYKAGKLAAARADHRGALAGAAGRADLRAGRHQGLVSDQWLGVFVPQGTPPAIVARLNAEIGKALADPAIRKNLEDSAQEPVGGSSRRLCEAGARRLSPSSKSS